VGYLFFLFGKFLPKFFPDFLLKVILKLVYGVVEFRRLFVLFGDLALLNKIIS